MNNIGLIIFAGSLSASILAESVKHRREIQFEDKATVTWEYDLNNLDAGIDFSISTNVRQFAFGWNGPDSITGADLIFFNCENQMIKAVNESRFEEPVTWGDTIITQGRFGTQYQANFTRSITKYCGDPIKINSETIRLMFITYRTNSEPDDTETGEIENVIYKTTHLIEYDPYKFQQRDNKEESCSSNKPGERTFCQEHVLDIELTAERTQYYCKFVKLPEPSSQTKNHMIGYEPINNDTVGVLHHVLMYTCSGITQAEMDNHHSESEVTNEYFRCGDYTMSYLQKCFHAVAVWAVGGSGIDFKENVGYPINGDFGADRFALMEIHFDNPSEVKPVHIQKAGLKLKFARDDRDIDAGLMNLGASWMFYLPPKQEKFSLWGTCSRDCLSHASGQADEFAFNIFAAFAHGHRHLTDLTVSKVSNNGTTVNQVFQETNYDRFYQEYKYLKEEVVVRQGEDLITKCNYKTGDTWTRGGLEQTNEMCYAFVYYYPRMEDISFCTSMTPFENIAEYFNIPNPSYQYDRPGFPDEFRSDDTNVEEYFNSNHPVLSDKEARGYEQMMRKSKQIPMCSSSGGSVFDELEPIEEPIAEPEGTLDGTTDNELPMGHDMKFIFPFIYESRIEEETCTIKPKSSVTPDTTPKYSSLLSSETPSTKETSTEMENDMDYEETTASATSSTSHSHLLILNIAITILSVLNIV